MKICQNFQKYLIGFCIPIRTNISQILEFPSKWKFMFYHQDLPRAGKSGAWGLRVWISAHFAKQHYLIIFNMHRPINTGGSHMTWSFSNTEGNSLSPAQISPSCTCRQETLTQAMQEEQPVLLHLLSPWTQLGLALEPSRFVLFSTEFPHLFKEQINPLNRNTSCLVNSGEVSLQNDLNPMYLLHCLHYYNSFQKYSDSILLLQSRGAGSTASAVPHPFWVPQSPVGTY